MKRILAVLSLLALTVLFLGSECKKKTFVTDSTYTEEITSFILGDNDGKELFKPVSLTEESFFLDSTSLRYYYRFDSSTRKISVIIADSPKAIYPYSSVYDALARVQDVLYGHMYRITGDDTVHAYKMIDSLNRFAYFLKLYSDNYNYRGWRFWGFIGGVFQPYLNPGVRVINDLYGKKISAVPPPKEPPSPLSSYPNDAFYFREDSIAKFPLGDSLTLLSSIRDLLFVEQGDSIIGPLNTVPYNSQHRTGWRIPAASNKFYHLILFDLPGRFSVRIVNHVPESTLIKTNDYFIPYKVDI